MENKQSRAIVITGMHRSGTSLLAQWLYKCGLHVGDKLLGASVGNREGHYEDIDFLNFHKQVLTRSGLHFNGLVTEMPESLNEREIKQINAIVASKRSRHALWGWKEPRTCLFLDVYRHHLPDAVYLIVIRDYMTVASSLISRIYRRTENKYAAIKGINKWIWVLLKQKRRKHWLQNKWAEHFLKTWLLYNREIKKLIQTLPEKQFMVVDQNCLLQHSKAIFDEMQNRWQLSDLQFTAYHQLFKQKLQSPVLDLAPFIKNKALIKEAEDLQNWLQEYVPVF